MTITNSPKSIWSEHLDVRTLAEHLAERVDTMECGDPAAAKEAQHTLSEVQRWIKDTLAEDVTMEEIPDRIRRIAEESSPTLVRSDFWEEFARDEAEQMGLLENLPEIIVRSIDWAKMAREMHKGWSSASMGGHLYSVRNS